MDYIPNFTIPGSYIVRNWGPGFSNSTTKLSAKGTLQLFPGTSIKGKRFENHPWSYQKITHLQDEKSFWQKYQYPYGTSMTGHGAGGHPSAPTCSISTVDPYSKCLGKIYDELRGDMDLSIDIAQMRQTAGTLGDCADAVVKIARGLTSVRKLSSAAANAWLLYQYGVKPTMQTMHDLLGKQIGLTCQKVKIVKRASNSNSSSSSFKSGTSLVTITDQHINSRIELGLDFSVSDAERYALSTYTSLNPLSIAWELLPYSFVWDWFMDVGGYLRNCETALMCGLACHGGYCTRTSLGKVTYSRKGYSDASTFVDCTSYSEVKSMNRTLMPASMPLPALPTFDVHLGTSRLLSAAALLRQILTRQ